MKSETTILLDKERIFKLNYNTLCNLEDQGYALEDISGKDGKVSFKALRALIWAGLVGDEEELTVSQVGALLTMDNTKDVAEAISNLMGNLKK